jgi:hypothetical protein
MSEARLKRARPADEPVDDRKELVHRFIAVLREDPWFNELPLEKVGFNISEYYNRICWLLLDHYGPEMTKEPRSGEWGCRGFLKLALGDEPREALIRWYIAYRAGRLTVSEMHAKEKADEEVAEGARKRRRRDPASDVPDGVEDGERRHRRSRST